LPRLIEALEDDSEFVSQALRELAFIDRVSTYSPASAVSGLINHWLVERDLKCYSRGQTVDDITDLTVYEINGSFDLSMSALEDSLKIDRDEFLQLLSERGFLVPTSLAAIATDVPHTPPQESRTEERKRSALVSETESFWPSIERDLRDASRNGLSLAAKSCRNTFWKVREALSWATERGKIKKPKAEAYIGSKPDSVLSPMLRQLLNLN
jgi:hypothetical protein